MDRTDVQRNQWEWITLPNHIQSDSKIWEKRWAVDVSRIRSRNILVYLPKLLPYEVINLYHEHGTSEQFHSEIKSDLGVERFPSCHFATNSLILHWPVCLQYSSYHWTDQYWRTKRWTSSRQSLQKGIQKTTACYARLHLHGRTVAL